MSENVDKKQTYLYKTLSPTQISGLADAILSKVFGFEQVPEMVTLTANQQGHFHFKAQLMYEDTIPFPQKRSTADKEAEKQKVREIATTFFKKANEIVKANKQPKVENQDSVRPMFQDRNVDRGAFPSDFPDLFPLQYLQWQSTEPIFHAEYPKNIHYYEVRFRVELPCMVENKGLLLEKPETATVENPTARLSSAAPENHSPQVQKVVDTFMGNAAKTPPKTATVQNEYVVLHINPDDKRYEIMGVESHFVQIAGQESVELLEIAGGNTGLYFLQEGNMKLLYWTAEGKVAATKVKGEGNLILEGDDEPKFYRHPMDAKGIYVYDLEGNFRFWIPYTRNEIHYVDEDEMLTFLVSGNIKSFVRETWESIKKEFRGEDKYFYANQIRRYSLCFIGANTFDALSDIIKIFYQEESDDNYYNHGKETGGLMYISDSRELLPYEFRDKDNKRAETTFKPPDGIPTLGVTEFMNDPENREKLDKEKKHFFCKWHSHPADGGNVPSGSWILTKEQLSTQKNIDATEAEIRSTNKDMNFILDEVPNYSVDKKYYHELPCILFNSYKGKEDNDAITIYRSNMKTKEDKIADFAKIYTQAPIWGGNEDNPNELAEHIKIYNNQTLPKTIALMSSWWLDEDKITSNWLSVHKNFFF